MDFSGNTASYQNQAAQKNANAPEADGNAPGESLTQRELEVLRHIQQGKSNREVAEALYISKRTVDFHLTGIYRKLQVNNRFKAIRRAAALGFVP